MANAEIVVIKKYGNVSVVGQPPKVLISFKTEHRNLLGVNALGKFVLGNKQ